MFAGDDHHLGRRIGPDPELLAKCWCSGEGQCVECFVMVADLCGQRQPSRSEGTQRVLGRCRRVDDLAGLEGYASIDELAVCEWLEGLAEPARRVDDQRLERADSWGGCDA